MVAELVQGRDEDAVVELVQGREDDVVVDLCRVHVRLHKPTWFACLAECMQHSLIDLDVCFDDFGFEFELHHF